MGKLGGTAVIINSRVDSKRVPGKVFHTFNIGKKTNITLLGALIYRLKKAGLPIILAVPNCQVDLYGIYKDDVEIFGGDYHDPLKRMSDAAREYSLDTVIRVCHDKIFVDEKMIKRAIEIYRNMEVDYVYSSHYIDGTGFEVIRAQTVHLASSLYKNVEHISYAIKAITSNVFNWPVPTDMRSDFSILADTPEDIEVLEAIFRRFKTATLRTPVKKIMEYLRIHPEVTKINKKPTLTVYTCCYNGEKYLDECIKNTVKQKGFKDYEYILIDDCSDDSTHEVMLHYSNKHKNIKVYRNIENRGLASSSNIALKMAKGKYITRIDADDYYSSKTSCIELLNAIRHGNMDAVYPANFFGSKDKIQSAEENHHIGGAIFNRRSINDIKFTEGLKGYEGLDFFHRARPHLRIGYLANPVFFYRQHSDSLTKENPEKRNKIKKGIMNELRQKMA